MLRSRLQCQLHGSFRSLTQDLCPHRKVLALHSSSRAGCATEVMERSACLWQLGKAA